MSGILAEFVEKIISLKDPTIIEVAGQQYANQEFARIKPHVDRPSMYEVTGLDSIVQLLRKEIERVGGFAFVRVAGHDRVYVSTSYRADMSRDTLYTATADVPGFRQGWRDHEQAVIELRSLFIPGEGTRYLLDLLSRMSKDSGVTTKDNGVSQTVEVKAGVSLKQNVEINPRVKLQPFRTFLEVEQPESEYLLRVDENGRIGLFEADGGVWKLEAKRNVKEYLAVELDDLVKSGQVVVMM